MTDYIRELLAGELRRRAPHVVTNPEDYPDDLDVGDVLEVAGGFSVVTPSGRWHLTEGQAAELVDTLAAGLRRQRERTARELRRPAAAAHQLEQLADY